MSTKSYEGNFDEDIPFIQMELDIRDVSQIHQALTYHSEKWYGNDIYEKQRIDELKDFFYRMILEYKFQVD